MLHYWIVVFRNPSTVYFKLSAASDRQMVRIVKFRWGTMEYQAGHPEVKQLGDAFATVKAVG